MGANAHPRQKGDYYIPDLKLPEENRPIGRYGRLHQEYLKKAQTAGTVKTAEKRKDGKSPSESAQLYTT